MRLSPQQSTTGLGEAWRKDRGGRRKTRVVGSGGTLTAPAKPQAGGPGWIPSAHSRRPREKGPPPRPQEDATGPLVSLARMPLAHNRLAPTFTQQLLPKSVSALHTRQADWCVPQQTPGLPLKPQMLPSRALTGGDQSDPPSSARHRGLILRVPLAFVLPDHNNRHTFARLPAAAACVRDIFNSSIITPPIFPSASLAVAADRATLRR